MYQRPTLRSVARSIWPFLISPRIARLLLTRVRARADARLLRESAAFDGQWYLRSNPDVLESGLDPYFHYARHGSSEGRDSGPGFDAADYLARYPDVAASGMDPLIHFLRYGKASGRQMRPATTEVEPAQVAAGRLVGVDAPHSTRTILVSYGTSEWHTSLLRLKASARRFGFTDFRVWQRRDLVQTPFYESHRAVLDQERGGGFWLWKPYYILRALEEARPGDAVVYADAGVAFTGDIAPLVDLCRREGGVLLFAGHYEGAGGPGPNINSYWTKRDCFIRMGADEPRVHGAIQADASFLVFIRNERSLAFARSYLQHCEDPAILTDAPLVSGRPNLPDFRDHRHDQSVLSVLAVLDDIPLHRHPSQWGNHLKAPAQRISGEWHHHSYSDSPWPDRYETLLDHHRERSDRHTLVRATDVRVELEENRAALREVRSWVSDDAYDAAVYQYGLPQDVRHLVDLDVGDEATYTDLIVKYARCLPQPVSYLELGVSVGKNFYQVLRALRSSRLVGFDFEDVSPTLRAKLGSRVKRLDSWPAFAGSRRKEPSTLDRYPAAPGENQVDYLCADIWDESAWARLAGRRFNVIFSDAEHSPEALRHEESMLERHDLIDPLGFVMVWDDLGGASTDAFVDVWERLRDRFALPDESLQLGLARGWLGVNEPPHLVGVIRSLDYESVPSDAR